jgi:hypothetical protein
VARTIIEDYDQLRHGNPMWYIDDAQRERYYRAPTIVPYKVCVVEVCGFKFMFHSLVQLRTCIDYFSCEHQPSSRLPVEVGHNCCSHLEVQRWYEKLPQYLLKKSKRRRVRQALQSAIVEYSKWPEADTGTVRKPVFDL